MIKITISFPVDETNVAELEGRLKLAGMQIDGGEHLLGVIYGRVDQSKIKELTFVDGVSFITSHGVPA